MTTSVDSAALTASIARLNDDARLGLDHRARVLFTRNCLETIRGMTGAHLASIQGDLLKAFRDCSFDADSPERDFAAIIHLGRKVWMKIDYYDADCEYGSEDPSDAAVTTRVVTILLPEDW